jgi:hypothetical protein
MNLQIFSVAYIVIAFLSCSMAVRSLFSTSGTTRLRAASGCSVDILHDTADHKLKYKDDAGTVQTLVTEGISGQALNSPTLTTPTLASPTVTGTQQMFAAAAAAGGSTEAEKVAVLANNTVVDFFTVTVPNSIAGASIQLLVSSMLGDGDSTDTAIYTVGISRIAGANVKAVISTKSVVGATAGATANAVITAAVSAITGAVGAVNTFTITIKNARSAGAADNHPTAAVARLVNLAAAGITIAAA